MPAVSPGGTLTRPANVFPPRTRRRGHKTKETHVAEEVRQYIHKDKRLNNPPVGLVTPASDAEETRAKYAYDPHIDPALQFDSGRAAVEKLIDEALASGDAAAMQSALKELKRRSEPYLAWTGKAERTSVVFAS
jgi:adenine-specific DNA-methyltransferase